jgi:hypothetical protein
MQGEKLQSPSGQKEGSITHLRVVVGMCVVWLWKILDTRETKKLALTRFELARFPITDWTEPKRDAITTRPQYRNDFAKEEGQEIKEGGRGCQGPGPRCHAMPASVGCTVIAYCIVTCAASFLHLAFLSRGRRQSDSPKSSRNLFSFSPLNNCSPYFHVFHRTFQQFWRSAPSCTPSRPSHIPEVHLPPTPTADPPSKHPQGVSVQA